jgi:dCMP deaminase
MRPSRHVMYMAMARAAAMRATCYRLNVGAVLVSENRNVIGIGYNGAPMGQPHCTGNGCAYFTDKGCKVVHAEVNALERSLHPQRRAATLYTTHSPCGECAERLLDSGDKWVLDRGYYPVVTSVYFETAYRDPSPVQKLLDDEIDVYQILPSGLLVDQRTGNLCPAE